MLKTRANFRIQLTLFISAHNSTIMSSRDCKSQTTNIYNLSKPHTKGETTVSSSVSRYAQQFYNRTHNHYSTEALSTVNTGMY
jgi:hypothetical protein